MRTEDEMHHPSNMLVMSYSWRWRVLPVFLCAVCLESGPACNGDVRLVGAPLHDAGTDTSCADAVRDAGGVDTTRADAAGTDDAACPSGGREAAILVASRGHISDLVVSGDYLVWSEAEQHAIVQMPIDGGEPIKLADADTNQLSADRDSIYWIDFARSAIMAVPARGGALATIAEHQNGAFRLLVRDNVVYWTALGTIHRKRLPDGEIETIATLQGLPAALAILDNRLYWASIGQSSIKWLPLDAPASTLEAPVVVAISQGTPVAMEASDLVLYWLNAGDGRIQSFADDGFGVVDISGGRSRYPFALAASPRAVYWTNEGDDSGFVLRAPRSRRFVRAPANDVTVFAACEPGLGTVRVARGNVFWSSMKAGGSISRLPE